MLLLYDSVKRFDSGLLGVHTASLVLGDFLNNTLVIIRNNLFEKRQIFAEIIKYSLALLRAGRLYVLCNQRLYLFDIDLVAELRTLDKLLVKSAVEVVVFVKNIGYAA